MGTGPQQTSKAGVHACPATRRGCRVTWKWMLAICIEACAGAVLSPDPHENLKDAPSERSQAQCEFHLQEASRMGRCVDRGEECSPGAGEGGG